MAAWYSTINNIRPLVSGEAILSAENSVKPLGGRGSAPNPLGTWRSPCSIAGWEEVAAPPQEPHTALGLVPFGLAPPVPWKIPMGTHLGMNPINTMRTKIQRLHTVSRRDCKLLLRWRCKRFLIFAKASIFWPSFAKFETGYLAKFERPIRPS